MKKLNFSKKQLLYLFPFAIIFIASLFQPADSDLGWHLKYGEYFFQNGHVLRDNIFSLEMPDYKWSNTSWLTDLISYQAFNNLGFFGLSILSALVVTATFYFFSKAAKIDYFEQSLIFPYLIVFINPVNSVSFRGQLLSLMLTGLMFWILRIFEERKKSGKIVFLLIPLFMLWVNTHGQFLIGLGLLAVWVFGFILKEFLFTKVDDRDLSKIKTLVLVAVLSVASTLINPFGVKIYEDIISHANNEDLKSIVEYLPFNELTPYWWNQVFIGFLLFFGLIFYFFEGHLKPKLPWTMTSLILFPLSFWVRRYSWTMYYLTMPLLKPVAAFFKPKSEKNANIAATVIFGLCLILVLWIANPFQRLQNMTWESYCRQFINCPDKAVAHLLANKYEGEMMSMYNWGGYLIWNYPQFKPSIDGRMHLWKDKTGYSAFSYYYAFEQNLKDIDDSKYDVVLMHPDKPVSKRLAQLANEGKWKLVHFDEEAVVFVRTNPN